MSEISNTPINIPISSVTISNAEATKVVRPEPFNSQVLAVNSQTISISVPGLAILVLDIGDNKQLQQLPAGQLLRVTVELAEQRQLTVTISKVIPPSQSMAEVPLSKDLANKLAANTKFPASLPAQLAFIDKNSPVAIGQARRLPREMIKLVTPDQKTISAALPSSSRVPLNQTYTLALVIAKDGSAQVQFTRLAPVQSPIIVSNTLSQLTENSPKIDLTKLLKMTTTSALSEIQNAATTSSVNNTVLPSRPTIDMSLPRNQLWLRYQPLVQVMTQLAQVTKEVAQLTPLPAMATRGAGAAATSPTQTSSGASITQQIQLSQSVKITAALTQSTPGASTSQPIPTDAKPTSVATSQPTPTGRAAALASTTQQVPASPTAPTTPTPQSTPAVQVPAAQSTATTPQVAVASTATVQLTSQTIHETPATMRPAAAPATPQMSQLPPTQSLTVSPKSETPPSAGETITPKISQGNSLSLQKLNALLATLKTQSSQQTSQQTAGPQSTPDNKQPEPSFDAIMKLQSLTKQLQHSLPNMQQLTSAPMLPNLIEQFVRFEPLALASINLTSLGSLASALQLLLGGRSALSTKEQSTQGLSPELTAQLKKILQQGKASKQANLLQSLAQLGNFSALKSLEETLTSLSGHLQLYQYQSQEQSNNNQQLFYFTLPTSESTLPQVEGQIEQQSDPEDPKRKTWQLTLLLPVGATDKIKASASLQGTSVEIELISNSDEIVKKAEYFTDFLSQRLASLGLTTTHISCKRADLPKSLLKRPNQLVELII